MTTGELLEIEPVELKFPFELKKLISCSLQLSNKTESHVAFKVKTTNPKKYCVRPNTGIVSPKAACDVLVTMQSQKEAPADLNCKDKFLVQSVLVSPDSTAKDITPKMFAKDPGNFVEECKLRVIYVSPPQPPSPVPEGSEEGSPPRRSLSDNNGSLPAPDWATDSRAFADSQEKQSDATVLISKLTDEKNRAIQENNKLRQELELLRREASRRSGGFSSLFLAIVIVLGILLGYFLKK